MKTLLFCISLCIFLDVAQAQRTINLREISPTYTNLGIDKVNLNLRLEDADLENTLLSGQLRVLDANNNQPIDSLNTSLVGGSTSLALATSTNYDLLFSADQYQDSILNLDLNRISTYDTNLIVRLLPRKKPFEISLQDFETGEEVVLGITLTNQNRNEIIELSAEDNQGGIFNVMIRENDEYELSVKTSNKFAFYNKIINKKGENEDKHIAKLIPVKLGALIPLYNITFQSRSAVLDQNSQKELTRVIDLLNNFPSILIEIRAHTDILGDFNYNMELSQKRAQAVYEYLIQNNILKSRLVAKGYGPTIPIASNDTETGRSQNRRFELKVIGI